ncbi:ATP-binding protein [Halovenus halobia]|uniref:PAS domain-containing sensor histidine kinase n=1 Tax=Halovenus halobia TaxID=3396622 RepID=UPI003F547248
MSKAESIVAEAEAALGFEQQETYSGFDVRDVCEEIAAEYDGYIAEIATELQIQTQAQQRFDTLLENVPDPAVVVMFDESVPVVKTVNREFETVFGYEKAAIRGEPLADLIVPSNTEYGMDVWARTNDETDQEVTRITATGEERTFLQRTAMETTIGGAVEGYGIYTDITERIERERDLDMLKQLFSRVFRHNIRNELSVVTARLSYIADRLTDESLTESAGSALQAANRLLSHAEKTRDIEKLIDTEPDRTEMSLQQLVGNAVAEQSELPADVSVEIDLPDESVHVVNGFDNAVSNAIENAITHNPGPITISIAAYVDNETVSLVISDTGEGIETNEIEMLNSGTETQLTHGSGVGLWVMNWYVKKSGGELEINGSDSGTTVTMHLKRARPLKTR